jgi:hypothetical protein
MYDSLLGISRALHLSIFHHPARVFTFFLFLIFRPYLGFAFSHFSAFLPIIPTLSFLGIFSTSGTSVPFPLLSFRCHVVSADFWPPTSVALVLSIPQFPNSSLGTLGTLAHFSHFFFLISLFFRVFKFSPALSQTLSKIEGSSVEGCFRDCLFFSIVNHQ